MSHKTIVARAPARAATAALCAFFSASGALTGCAKDTPETERVVLPGFSIELPVGQVISTSSVPTAGKHAVHLPAPGWSDMIHGAELADRELEVHWTTNAIAREIWSSQLMPAMATKLPGAEAGAKVLEERSVADDRWLFVVGTETSPVGVGIVNCEPRFSIVVSYVRFTNRVLLAEELHRILQSVQCAVTDANRARPVVATRLPGKFGRVENPTAQIYRSLDGEFLSISVGADDMQRNPDALKEIIQAISNAIIGVPIEHWQYVQNPSPDRNTSMLTATLPGNGVRVYFGARYCTALNLSLMSFWFGPRGTDDLARERFAQIGCPGEATTTPGDFLTIAHDACAAGDQGACNLPPILP